MDAQRDLQRELANLAGHHPVERLKALHELGLILQEQLRATLDAAELEQVRVLGKMNPTMRPSWGEIGRALDVSHTQAHRRFADRL